MGTGSAISGTEEMYPFGFPSPSEPTAAACYPPLSDTCSRPRGRRRQSPPISNSIISKKTATKLTDQIQACHAGWGDGRSAVSPPTYGAVQTTYAKGNPRGCPPSRRNQTTGSSVGAVSAPALPPPGPPSQASTSTPRSY